MPHDELTDRHLAAAYDAVLVALYRTKQAAWSAAGSVYAADLVDLRDYLIEQSQAVDEAEANIDGRAERLSTPSSHQQGNLAAESGGDVTVAVRMLTDHLAALQNDLRERAAAIGDRAEGSLLAAIATGIEERSGRLISKLS